MGTAARTDDRESALPSSAIDYTDLVWIWVGIFSLVAGGWLLLATDTTVDRLAWLVDSFRAGDDPLSGSGVRSLRRGVEVWGWSGVVLGAATIPLWSSRVRAFLAAGFFQVANRLSRPLPLTADRYDGRFLLATGGVLAFTLLAHWSLTAYKDLRWFGGEDGASE